MTDNEIIKALECCFTRGFDESTCYECPFYTATAKCTEDLRDSALDLINRQAAENERLKAENKSIRYCYEQAKSYNDTLAESCEKNCKHFNMTTRAEALKEFAERVKKHSFVDNLSLEGKETVYVDDIDKLVKEMTEEKSDV